MTCGDALDRMLEADPAALKGEPGADTALARHLGECARCRTVATTLATELEMLGAGLNQLPAVTSPPRRRALSAWWPVAAAAILAAVLILGRDAGRGPVPLEGGVAASPEFPDRVAVTLPADRGGAVMSTSNPKITVVWLYERSER